MIYALGAFDGFHLGHQRLLERARSDAEKRGVGWGVVTFEGHPRMLLNKSSFKLLFTPPERDLIARYLGIPSLEKIHFTQEFAALTPVAFADYLSSRWEIDGLVTGQNFRFGRGRSGDPRLLAGLCEERGWSLSVVPSFMQGDAIVSSTEVRGAVFGGRMERAASLLGYPYMISGAVAHGDGRGRSLGFPTANISVRQGKLYPPEGVYSAIVRLDGRWLAAALNIGSNPTFDGERASRCEAHITGVDADLYGRRLTFFLLTRLRGELRFPSAESLVERIAADSAECSAIAEAYARASAGKLEKFAAIL